jgi:CRP-like cAMP-binding protein
MRMACDGNKKNVPFIPREGQGRSRTGAIWRDQEKRAEEPVGVESVRGFAVYSGIRYRAEGVLKAEMQAMVRRMEKFHPLPPGGADRILAIARPLALEAGEYFVRAGEPTDKAAFLAEGWLRYYFTDAEGREFVRYFCDGDDFVASLTALSGGRPSSFSIQAITASRLLVFRYADWLALLREDPAWGMIHQAIQERALALAEERERSLILDDASTRYRRFVEGHPGAEKVIRQYDIASYLGISPVTLSRIRGKAPKRN